MAGQVEDFDPSTEFDFLKKSVALPKSGASEFKSEGVQAVNLQEELTKEAQGPGAAPLRDLDDADSDLPPADLPIAAPAAKAAPVAVVKAKPPERAKESSFFSTSRSTPIELDRTLIDKYGVEWLDWEPETITQSIRQDWNTQISRINMDKIMASKLLHVSDEFWRHWEVFQKVVLSFNNITPLFDRVQEVTVAQIVHALNQVGEIRKEEFQDEVLYYIATMAKEEGFIWLPSPLEPAQKHLDELNPPEAATLKAEIRERWESLDGGDLRKMEFQEDLYGVHLAKLASIDLYLDGMSAPENEEDV